MEKIGFDEIRIDPIGKILGRIGDPKEWSWDPYKGKVEDAYSYGRGAGDQRAGMASMVYARKMIKELGLEGDYTLCAIGSVQEEDCDGLPLLYILNENGIKPDCVVITEPTSLRTYRGQRGRMEIEAHIRGKSCHASAPERGDNPIYKRSRPVVEVEKLNERLHVDPFLGKGSIAVTEMRSLSPSLCAPGRRRPKWKSSGTKRPAILASSTQWRSTIQRGCSTNPLRWRKNPSKRTAHCGIMIQWATSGPSAQTASAPWD